MPPIKRKIIKVAKNCPFCKEDKDPHFRDVAVLSKYVSERGRIISRSRTGICATHQRALSREIKRARHLALLPFVSGL
jgi:small subunit ribosomal protein S18